MVIVPGQGQYFASQHPLEGFSLNLFQKKEKKVEDTELTKQQIFVLDIRDIVYILAVVVVIYLLFFRVVSVVGDSMFDTLVDGDRVVIVSNLIYRQPKAGDIVIASKDSFRDGECIVKRIIATEGQEVDIDFNTGIVSVDGVPLDEDYTFSNATNFEGVIFPHVVEDGCVFLMGDNRIVSHDSRSPLIGDIDVRQIMGKVVFLLFPGNDGGTVTMDFSRIGVIG
jgi:signal peptidase I